MQAVGEGGGGVGRGEGGGVEERGWRWGGWGGGGTRRWGRRDKVEGCNELGDECNELELVRQGGCKKRGATSGVPTVFVLMQQN